MVALRRSDDRLDDFEEDPRYRVSVREALLSLAYWALFTAAMIGVAWGLGHRDPAEISYILGFPDWFFWSGLVTTGVFCTVVPYVLIRFFFTEVPLDPIDPGDGPDEPGDAGAGR